MKKFIILVLIVLAPQTICGQVISIDNTIVIAGKVIDAETGHPLEYATISFLRAGQDKIIGTTSDKNGQFKMEIDAGIYSIKIDFLSYKTYRFKSRLLTKNLDLGSISLASGTVLDEVEVTAEKKLLEFEINKKTYNASADIANRGGNGLDVLNNTPSVRVDAEGTITVRGSNATVLIDGKPQFNIDNNTDLLKAIPSNSIDKVEIITRSAKYSAEGGGVILNIITKKRRSSGFSGSFNLHTGIPDNHGISTFLNKTSKTVNLYTTISYVNENRIKETTVEQPLLGLFQDIEEDRFRNTILVNLGSDFYLNDNNTVSASVLVNKNDKNNTFKNLENDFTRFTDDRDDSFKYEASLGYVVKLDTLGQKLSVDFKYDGTLSDTRDAILETPTTSLNNVVQQSKKDQQLNSFLTQLNYTVPFTKDKNLELGYKGTFRKYENIFKVEQFDDSMNDFVIINNLDDTFNYDENVHAFFGQYNATHGSFSYSLGLRTEISEITTSLLSATPTTKNYTDLFPSLTMAYEINDDSFLSLSYNRSIDRPSIPQLNPFFSFADERFQSTGNQNLNPYYTNYFELVFDTSFEKVTFTTAFFLNYQKDQFLSVIQNTGQFASNGDQIFRRNFINSGHQNIIGLELDINYTPFKGLRLYGFITPFRQEITNAINADYNNENIVVNAQANALISLNDGLKFSLGYAHQSQIDYGIAKLKPIHLLNGTVSKELFKQNGMVTFKAIDIFKSKRFIYESTEANTQTNYDVFYQNQFTLSFTYRFNQKRKSRKDRSNDVHKDDLEDKQDKKM